MRAHLRDCSAPHNQYAIPRHWHRLAIFKKIAERHVGLICGAHTGRRLHFPFRIADGGAIIQGVIPANELRSTPHPIDILLVEDNVPTSASTKKCSLTAKFTIFNRFKRRPGSFDVPRRQGRFHTVRGPIEFCSTSSPIKDGRDGAGRYKSRSGSQTIPSCDSDHLGKPKKTSSKLTTCTRIAIITEARGLGAVCDRRPLHQDLLAIVRLPGNGKR